MKKILITGLNSYIGNSFSNYLSNWPKEYLIDKISLRDNKWRQLNFSAYDSVFHVAGIVHQKETEENVNLYYEINTDLAMEVAKKAKAEGVKQFILMSSMSVYGIDTGKITLDTQPKPKTNYGKSKLQAEQRVVELVDKNFRVAIIRPPMVYGSNCKGNFMTLVRLVKKISIFPKVNNKRSMIYIDNLSEFVKDLIDEERGGLFIPQNSEYMNTTEMTKWIAEALGKKMYISRILGMCLFILLPFCKPARKAFGSLTYCDCQCSIVVDLKRSVINSVSED